MANDPRVDTYIAEAEPFARPILTRLRRLVHTACPDVEEAIKWSSPFFLHRGKILCFTAAFKAHLAFGFWGPAMKKVLAADGRAKDGRGLFGRITSVADLPSDAKMIRYLRTAQKLLEAGATVRGKSKARPALAMPADLAAALRRNRAAAKTWDNFSPSARRDYIEWVVEAKRPETRAQRLETAVAWVAEGKRRNWKYESC